MTQYLKICRWSQRRYGLNGCLVITQGGQPTRYSRIEALAWSRYMA